MNYIPELPDGLEMIQPDEDELKDIRYTDLYIITTRIRRMGEGTVFTG